MIIAQKHHDRLQDLKKNVEASRKFFEANNKRFEDFMRFVFFESVTDKDRSILNEIGKPSTEFNILEAYISRLRGEFAKQQPSLTVRAADGIPIYKFTDNFSKVIKAVEAHLRAIFFDASNDKLEYDTYSDLLGGGFGVFEVFTDYVSNKSFDQNIKVGRPFSPLMCGFDPMAQLSHKGDGRYCYQLHPKTKDDFAQEYGSALADSVKLSSSIDGFSWGYKGDGGEEVILICDYYEKQIKDIKIHKLSNDLVVTDDEYKLLLERWQQAGFLEQPPISVLSRKSVEETIVRYRFCDNQMIESPVKTNFSHLPLVFVDGNSIKLSLNKTYEQITRPYVYHAKGIQKLKNFAGQSLGAELENLVQHKFVVAKESMPEKGPYLDAYQNVQKAETLVYHHFYKGDTQVPLPPPREIQRAPIPPDIMATFMMSDQTTQSILGSYDSALGINDNQLSGIAITNGAMQSNNASVPYLVGYIKGMNRVAEIIVDLLPKYYRTPRTIPVLTPSGKRDFITVNQHNDPESIDMKYDQDSLQVKVETGVNFALQKEASLRTIKELMQASPTFAEFINTKGLTFILDNIEIRGIEELKEKATEFEKENEQKQKQQSQMQEQMMQEQMKLAMAKGQADVQLAQAAAQKTGAEAMIAAKESQGSSKSDLATMKIHLDAEKAAADEEIKQQEIDLKVVEMLADVQSDVTSHDLKQQQIDAENERSEVEALQAMATASNKNIEVEE